MRNIPKDAAKYQEWLIAQRKDAKQWEFLYESFLSVKPGSELTTHFPRFMRSQLPTLFAPMDENWSYAPLNEDCIYTVDLDREIFSVNNHYYFKLEGVPHIKWEDDRFGEMLEDRVDLPDPVPMGYITDFVIEKTIQSSELTKPLNNISMNDVSPLSTAAFVRADSNAYLDSFRRPTEDYSQRHQRHSVASTPWADPEGEHFSLLGLRQ